MDGGTAGESARLRFLLPHSGQDMAPMDFPLGTTVLEVKTALQRDWPSDDEFHDNLPEMPLLLGGKVLDNTSTLRALGVPSSAERVVTMHLVLRPRPQAMDTAEKEETRKEAVPPPSCCTIT